MVKTKIMVRIQCVPSKWLVAIQFVLAFEWLKSGIGKFTGHAFMANIGQTLEVFKSKTPHRWFASFLDTMEPSVFGNITRFSEVLVGSALILGGLYVLKMTKLNRWAISVLALALLGGALLNLNFYLAAGFSSPSTEGINIVMGLIQLILAAFYINVLKRK